MVILHHAAVVQDLSAALAVKERGAACPSRPQARSMVLPAPWARGPHSRKPCSIPEECSPVCLWDYFPINLRAPKKSV